MVELVRKTANNLRLNLLCLPSFALSDMVRTAQSAKSAADVAAATASKLAQAATPSGYFSELFDLMSDESLAHAQQMENPEEIMLYAKEHCQLALARLREAKVVLSEESARVRPAIDRWDFVTLTESPRRCRTPRINFLASLIDFNAMTTKLQTTAERQALRVEWLGMCKSLEWRKLSFEAIKNEARRFGQREESVDEEDGCISARRQLVGL